MCEKGKRVRLGKEKPAQWSIVRSRRSVNPEADTNIRAGAGQNSSSAISNQGRAEVQGGRRDRWETRQVGDAKGVTHTSPGQRPGFISPKTHQR